MSCAHEVLPPGMFNPAAEVTVPWVKVPGNVSMSMGVMGAIFSSPSIVGVSLRKGAQVRGILVIFAPESRHHPPTRERRGIVFCLGSLLASGAATGERRGVSPPWKDFQPFSPPDASGSHKPAGASTAGLRCSPYFPSAFSALRINRASHQLT